MKQRMVIGVVMVAVALSWGCKCETQSEAFLEEGPSKLVGPYLGQEPPGAEPALFAPGLVSTGAQELSLCASPDGDEIYFFVTGAAFNPRIIMETRREDSGWSTPREVSFFSSDRSDSYPFVAPDGQRIFFCSNRAGADGEPSGHHPVIWVADREGEGWGEARKLKFGDEESALGTFPSVAANGNLYFNGGSNAAGSDIFVSRFDGEGYGEPENLGEAVNSEEGDFHPYIAPDERYILFDSQREDGGRGSNDLYISVREEDGSWGEAQNLGDVVNTAFGDMRPFVTADGLYLFFASSRPIAREFPENPIQFEELQNLVNGPGNRLQDIYWVSADFLDEFLQ
jgi:hypothetical protein